MIFFNLWALRVCIFSKELQSPSGLMTPTPKPHSPRPDFDPLSDPLFDLSGCELFSPLEGPGSHRGGNRRKMGKITKFPSPIRPPKKGKIAPKKG